MAILKLGLGRDNAIVGNVVNVTLSEGQYNVQYKFDFDNGDILYLNKDLVEKQTQRLQILPNELTGMVTFWKKPMPNDPTGRKGYLNIELGGTPTSRPNKVAEAARNDDYVGRDLRNAGLPLAATTYETVKDRYAECLGDAIAILADAAEMHQTSFTPAEITAAAATLFIERNKRGV
jgi:hypothetical protein